jgi:hypothetical protein
MELYVNILAPKIWSCSYICVKVVHPCTLPFMNHSISFVTLGKVSSKESKFKRDFKIRIKESEE